MASFTHIKNEAHRVAASSNDPDVVRLAQAVEQLVRCVTDLESEVKDAERKASKMQRAAVPARQEVRR
jgi:hypothetical protein